MEARKLLPEPHIYPDRASLPKALRRFYCGGQMPVFRHPMLVALFPMAFFAPVEQIIEIRQAQADQMLADGNLSAYLFRHERAFRMTRLLDMLDSGVFEAGQYRPKVAAQFWTLARWVWTDAETPEDHPIWTSLIGADVPHREFMGGREGRRALLALPDTVTVFRGVSSRSEEAASSSLEKGWSWTTRRAVAHKFAHRLKGKNAAFVATGKVPRSEIVAYLLSRGENETLIAPGSIRFSLARA